LEGGVFHGLMRQPEVALQAESQLAVAGPEVDAAARLEGKAVFSEAGGAEVFDAEQRLAERDHGSALVEVESNAAEVRVETLPLIERVIVTVVAGCFGNGPDRTGDPLVESDNPAPGIGDARKAADSGLVEEAVATRDLRVLRGFSRRGRRRRC